jgi:transposase-like protein
MAGTRRRHSASFKAKVALEAARQTRTVAELAKAYQLHPVQISQWKKQLLDGAESLFWMLSRSQWKVAVAGPARIDVIRLWPGRQGIDPAMAHPRRP